MKALVYDRYGPPDVLEVRDLAPPLPGPGQVLVRIEALPVGPGDCKLRAGLLGAFFAISFPKVPGRYGAGLVVARGAGVGWPGEGDRVVLASLHHDGGTAAGLVVRQPSQMARAPAGLSPVAAAALVQGGVSAWACLEAGRVGRGTRVLIQGAAGAVGSACIELARHAGACATAVCRGRDEAFVRGLGADEVAAFDLPGEVERAAGQDVVIDLVGGEVHARSYALLRRGGRLVYLNALPIVDQGALHGVEVIQARIDDSGVVLDRVARLAEAGVLRPRAAAVLPLEAAAEAHRMVEAGAARRGRVVLVMPEGPAPY